MSEASDTLRKMAALAAAELFTMTMRRQGWALFHSRTLDVDLVVVDETHRGAAAGTATAPELPHFTLAEFEWIGRTKPPLDRLRAIVDAKREVPGTTIAMDFA